MDPLPSFDPFAELGLPVGASPAEADAARRRLARRWHPDRPGGDAAKMSRINQAADVLTDPVLRERYLAYRTRATADATGPAPGPSAAPRTSAPQQPSPRGTSFGPNDALVRDLLARIPRAPVINARGAAVWHTFRRAWVQDVARGAGLWDEAAAAGWAARMAAQDAGLTGLAAAYAQVAMALTVIHALRPAGRRDFDALYRAILATPDSPFARWGPVRPVGLADRLADAASGLPGWAWLLIAGGLLYAAWAVLDAGGIEHAWEVSLVIVIVAAIGVGSAIRRR